MDIPGNVHHILQGKSDTVWTADPGATVYEALKSMGEKNIGALVVTEGDRVLGVISERDYSRKVVLMGRSSRDTRVGEIIRQPAITVGPEASIAECMQLMTEHRIRHLPVIDKERLVGIVSIGDLVNWTMSAQSDAIEHLKGYITGQYPA